MDLQYTLGGIIKRLESLGCRIDRLTDVCRCPACHGDRHGCLLHEPWKIVHVPGPVPPPHFEGYEWTGEFREPWIGEPYLSGNGCSIFTRTGAEEFLGSTYPIRRYIYRKLPPTPGSPHPPYFVAVGAGKFIHLCDKCMDRFRNA